VKKVFLYIIFIVFPLVALTQTKIISFYFENNKSVPTLDSQNQLSLFKQSFDLGEFTILEIFSYTDSLGSVIYNYSLAKKRLDYVSNFLGIISSSSIQLKPYGIDRKNDLKDYKNWRRVDIYYILNDEEIIQKQDAILELLLEKEIKIIEIEKELNLEIKDTVNPDLIDASFRASLPSNMNIEFTEGTSNIESRSFVEIKKMYDYLSTHTSVNILIRGHVCCGNNMRLSKSRAKSVYKELLKMGIAKNRLNYIGMSNKEPLIFPEITDKDRQGNRRVDVQFIPAKP